MHYGPCTEKCRADERNSARFVYSEAQILAVWNILYILKNGLCTSVNELGVGGCWLLHLIFSQLWQYLIPSDRQM